MWNDDFEYKEVVRVDKNGEIVETYDCVEDVCRRLFIPKHRIVKICDSKNVYSTINKSFWFYKEDYNENIKNKIINQKKYLNEKIYNTPVMQYSINGELIKEYKSIDEAAKYVNANKMDILNSVDMNSLYKIRSKSIWILKKDSNRSNLNKKIEEAKVRVKK